MLVFIIVTSHVVVQTPFFSVPFTTNTTSIEFFTSVIIIILLLSLRIYSALTGLCHSVALYIKQMIYDRIENFIVTGWPKKKFTLI